MGQSALNTYIRVGLCGALLALHPPLAQAVASVRGPKATQCAASLRAESGAASDYEAALNEFAEMRMAIEDSRRDGHLSLVQTLSKDYVSRLTEALHLGVTIAAIADRVRELKQAQTLNQNAIKEREEVATGNEHKFSSFHLIADLEYKRFDAQDAFGISENKKRLATADANGSIHVWDLQDGTHQTMLNADAHVHSVALSPDGSLLAATTSFGNAFIWDLKTKRKNSFQVPAIASMVLFAPGDKYILLAMSGSVEIRDRATLEVLHQLKTRPHSLPSVWTDLSGHRLLTFSSQEAILWDLQKGEAINKLPVATRHVWQPGAPGLAALSPLGDLVATIDPGNIDISVWTPGHATPVVKLKPDRKMGPLSAVTFSPNGELVAVVGENQKVAIYSAVSGEFVSEFDLPFEFRNFAFSSDSRDLMVSTSNNAVASWDCGTGQKIFSQTFKMENEAHVTFISEQQLLTQSSTGASLWNKPMGLPKD